MKTINITIAANITYNGYTYNTPLHLEYEHTGKQFFKSESHYTENEEIAESWKKEGKKVKVKEGYYFIKRIAIPTINAKGEKDIWYINNPNDSYRINKVSKHGKKIHEELSKHQNPIE